MKLGLLAYVAERRDISAAFSQVARHGLHYCQLSVWNHALFTEEVAEEIRAYSQKFDVSISTLWCGWSGPQEWNFYEGQQTLGIVPEKYRAMRVAELKRGAEFAAALGVPQMATHMGFLPENPLSPEYKPVVAAIREIASHAQSLGVRLLLETGQETPVTLARVIKDVGLDNVGVNLDPANLILYGKANPTDGKNLGRETPLGEGKVNYPVFIAKLKALGYDGHVTIEREITGEEQNEDISRAIRDLSALFEA